MSRALLFTVRLHDGRFHGLLGDNRTSEWPPSPARLFQALIAGVARGSFGSGERAALALIEKLDAPIIAAPIEFPGQPFAHFMPNNDLDAKGGDIRRIGEVRSATKRYRPRIFDQTVPFLYVWTFEPHGDNEAQAHAIARLAEQLYQLGRGVDMAWAVGEVLDQADALRRLDEYPGTIYRPGTVGNGVSLDCPTSGSLASLCERHQQSGQRFKTISIGGKPTLLFSQAPRPRFHSVAYNCFATFLLFDIRDMAKAGAPFVSWPLERAAALVRTLRGEISNDGAPTSGAAWRLWEKLPERRGEIARSLIGRNATDADKTRRIRILPLPSIGHVHADPSIRRVLVELSPNCSLRTEDVEWAFSGLEVKPILFDEGSGEIQSHVRLVPAQERTMLKHYGAEGSKAALTWRSVTPVALPDCAKRRRIEPTRLREEAKGGAERLAEIQRAAGAVLHALRHAEIRTAVEHLRVQREPFEAKGARAEAFAVDTRFAKERLWHVEVTFAEPVTGPLVIGDGRYSGLGLMHPVLASATGALAFEIVDGMSGSPSPAELARALRRAVMSRVQGLPKNIRGPLPLFFSGHEATGAPARRGGHAHLAFVPDLERKRLLIVAPHLIEHREATRNELRHLDELEEALTHFSELRAGRSGKLKLKRSVIEPDIDPLFAPSRSWATVTPFLATRHPKRMSVADGLRENVLVEVGRRGVPVPLSVGIGEIIGNGGQVHLRFAVAVPGPMLLGRTLHQGGGLFVTAPA